MTPPSTALPLAFLYATLFFEAACTAAVRQTLGAGGADIAPAGASWLHVLLALSGLALGAALSAWRQPPLAGLVGTLVTALAAVLATLGASAAGAVVSIGHPLAVVGLLAALGGPTARASPQHAMAMFILTALVFNLAERPTVLGLGPPIAYGLFASLVAAALARATLGGRAVARLAITSRGSDRELAAAADRGPSEAPPTAFDAGLARQTAFAALTLALAASATLARPPVGEEPGVPYVAFCALPVLLLVAVPVIHRTGFVHWMGACLVLVAFGLGGAVPWIPRWLPPLSLSVSQLLLAPITLAWVTREVRPGAAAVAVAASLGAQALIPRLLALHVAPDHHRLGGLTVLALAIVVIACASRIEALRSAREPGPARF